MKSNESVFSSRQIIFQELFIGILIYAVVLGFFNDYTTVVDTKSFSTVFLSSVVLEFLTYLAFSIKSKIIKLLSNRQGMVSKIIMFFSVWLVMFSSKFVFVWIIDKIFGDNININGFFGILLVVLSVTIIHKGTNKTFLLLGESNLND